MPKQSCKISSSILFLLTWSQHLFVKIFWSCKLQKSLIIFLLSESANQCTNRWQNFTIISTVKKQAQRGQVESSTICSDSFVLSYVKYIVFCLLCLGKSFSFLPDSLSHYNNWIEQIFKQRTSKNIKVLEYYRKKREYLQPNQHPQQLVESTPN